MKGTATTDSSAPLHPGRPPGGPNPPAAAAPLSAAEDTQKAMLSHFLNIILLGPALVIFLVFKDRGQQVAFESKEPLNWAIYVAGAVIVLNIIFCIKGGLTVKEDGSYR